MLKLSHPQIGPKARQAVLRVLDSGQIASGPEVRKFEAAFARYIGTRYAVATANGTSALHTALLALGIKRGDEVITTPFSFIATANSILFCGAEPVFCDIDPLTFNISPDEIEGAFRRHPKIKAMLVVHLYGLSAEMDEICRIAKARGVFLIEDCAQAVGSEFKGKKAGRFGDISAFSFYATKNLTTGEGGMVTTNSARLQQRARAIINHGRIGRFRHAILGYNYRMTDIAAALGLEALVKLDRLNARRMNNAKFLSANLKGIPWLGVPYVPAECLHTFHQYTMRVPENERNRFINYLQKNGVEAAAIYHLPIHKQPLYRKLGYGKLSLPAAERAAREVVSIPVGPHLKMRDLKRIIRLIWQFKRSV